MLKMMKVDEIKSVEYTYEIGQVAGILANPNMTLEKILKYRQETQEHIEFEKAHGIDLAHEVRAMRIWDACIALLKPMFTL
jgi:hypothetical protein